MPDTRERLVATATELFLGKGYGAVGTSRICAAAGITKGTFYQFFESRSDLLIVAMKKYAAYLDQAFKQISRRDQGAVEKIRALFEVPADMNRRWQLAKGVAQGCLVGTMALELGAADENVQRAAQAALRQWEKSIEPVVTAFRDEQALPGLDPAEGAKCIVAMIQGGQLMARVHNDPNEISSLAPAAVGALRALAARHGI